MIFNFIPAHHHRFDAGQGFVSGGGEIDVGDDERAEGPRHQAVERRQEGQPAQRPGDLGPALHAPHQRAGDDLQGQQHVQDAKVGDLLQRVHLLLRGLLEGVLIALEDALHVELGLHNGLVKEAVGMGNELADLAADQVVEQRQRGVEHQQGRQHIMHQHNILEAEQAKDIRAVNDQAGEEQQHDDKGLQPVPEALVYRVHVHLFDARPGMCCAPGSIEAQPAVRGHRAQHADEEERPKCVNPVDPVVAEDVQVLVTRGRLVVQGAILNVQAPAGNGVGILDELGHHFVRQGIRQLHRCGDARVIRMASFAILDSPLVAGNVVIDAVRLHLAHDVRVFQPQVFQAPGDERLLFRRINHQLGLAQGAVAILVKSRQHGRGVAAIFQPGGLQVGQAHRAGAALGILVDPVPGCHQVIGSQHHRPIHVLARQQHRLEARHQVAQVSGRCSAIRAGHAAALAGRLAGSGQHGPIVLLDGRGIHLRNVAAFAGQLFEVALGVGQPVVGIHGVMAGFAAPHAALQLGGNGVLGALAAGKVVVGALQVLANLQAAGVKFQVLGAGLARFFVIGRVVQREVAVGALHAALGVDIPGAHQAGFAGQVDARSSNLLP